MALITGGGSGIGRATALAFAREGAQVVIGNRNVERGEETVSMIRKAGGMASFQQTDVMVAAEVEEVMLGREERRGREAAASGSRGSGMGFRRIFRHEKCRRKDWAIVRLFGWAFRFA